MKTLLAVIVLFVSSTAFADTVTLTNGPNGGGAAGCPNGSIVMDDGETIYFRACTGYPLNIWRYATGETFSVPGASFSGNVVSAENLPSYDSSGNIDAYITFNEQMATYTVKGGSGRLGGGTSTHWKVLGGSITISQ